MKRYEYNYGKNPEGVLSTISGYATETTNYGETAFGILNKSTRDDSNYTTPEVVSSSTATLFSVGNGTDHENRKNIIELKADGTVFISGVGGYDGTNPEDATNIADEFQGIHDDIDDLNDHVDRIDNTIESIHIAKDENSDLIYTLFIDGENRGTINIPKDQFLRNVRYDTETNELIFSFVTTDNDNQEVRVNLTDLEDIYTPGDGINIDNKEVSVKVDADTQPYIIVTANGVKIVGIDEKFNTINQNITDLTDRVTTAENDIDTLETRMDTAENSIEAIQGDLGALVGDGEGSVQDQINKALEDYLPLSGGTMTGSIEFISDPANGYEYVDLGLPSGTLWAKYNVGANSEEETGLYFQWGDTQGYTAEQVGNEEGQKAFTWNDYKFSIDGSSSNFSKYNLTDNKSILDLEDDAAHTNMGGDWKMPTRSQMEELVNNTDQEIVQIDRIYGYKFMKKEDHSIYIFLPTSGNAEFGSVQGGDLGSYMWTSSLLYTNDQSACKFGSNAGSGYVYNDFRCSGSPVRGVLPKSTETSDSANIIVSSNGITIPNKSNTDLVNAAGGTTSISDITSNLATKDEVTEAIGNIDLSNYVTLDGEQTVTGPKTFIPKSTLTQGYLLKVYSYDLQSYEHPNIGFYEADTQHVNLILRHNGYIRLQSTGSDNPTTNKTNITATNIQITGPESSQTIRMSYNGITVVGKSTSDLLNAAGSTTSISDIATQIQAAIVDSAPETLDTLNELAAALNDDPNFATTITNQIAQKADKTVATTDADGLMSAEDKAKLDSISTDVNHAADLDVFTGVQTLWADNGSYVTLQFAKNNTLTGASATANGSTLYVATQQSSGFMSAADKTKLDSITITDGDMVADGFRIPDGTANEVLTADGDSNTLKTINGQTLLGEGDIDLSGYATSDSLSGYLKVPTTEATGSASVDNYMPILGSLNNNNTFTGGLYFNPNTSVLKVANTADQLNDYVSISNSGINIAGKTTSDLLNAAGGTTTLKTLGGESILGTGNFDVAAEEDIQALFN